MLNRLIGYNLDNGVTFVQFLWEECKAELESFTQSDIDEITEVIRRRSTYSRFKKVENPKIKEEAKK